jgi:ribosomal protein L9
MSNFLIAQSHKKLKKEANTIQISKQLKSWKKQPIEKFQQNLSLQKVLSTHQW